MTGKPFMLLGAVVGLSSLGLFSQPVLAQVVNAPYAQVKQWTVQSAKVGGQFAFCSATQFVQSRALRFAFDGTHWGVGTQGSGNNVSGQLGVDTFQQTVKFENIGIGDGFLYTQIAPGGVPILRNGARLRISLGQAAPATFALSGSSAAMLKVQECVQRKGVAPRQQVAAQPAPQGNTGFGATMPKPMAVPTPGVMPKPMAVPTPGVMPKPMAVPTPGTMPKPMAVPTPGVMPKPMAVPTPGTMPKPMAVPTPGTMPKPMAVPTPGAMPKPLAVPTPGTMPKPMAVAGLGGGNLPKTGLSQGQARALLKIAGGQAPSLDPGCKWVVNETGLPGGEFLLYLAAQCKGITAEMGFAAGARRAVLSIVKSALFANTKMNWEIASVYHLPSGQAAAAAVYQRALTDYKKPNPQRPCYVQSGVGQGYPSDSFVFDIDPKIAAKEAQDGPRGPECGSFGVGDGASFWRPFGGFLAYFDFGQDAHGDIDTRSLTVIRRAANGTWAAVK